MTPAFLEELAKFIKARYKFSGSGLATICIWMGKRVANDSLIRLCSRFHAKSMLFLKRIFSLLLQQKICE